MDLVIKTIVESTSTNVEQILKRLMLMEQSIALLKDTVTDSKRKSKFNDDNITNESCNNIISKQSLKIISPEQLFPNDVEIKEERTSEVTVKDENHYWTPESGSAIMDETNKTINNNKNESFVISKHSGDSEYENRNVRTDMNYYLYNLYDLAKGNQVIEANITSLQPLQQFIIANDVSKLLLNSYQPFWWKITEVQKSILAQYVVMLIACADLDYNALKHFCRSSKNTFSFGNGILKLTKAVVDNIDVKHQKEKLFWCYIHPTDIATIAVRHLASFAAKCRECQTIFESNIDLFR